MKELNYLLILILSLFLIVPTSATATQIPKPLNFNTIEIMEQLCDPERPNNSVGHFTENQGQWGAELLFIGNAPFGQLGFGKGCVYFGLCEPSALDPTQAFDRDKFTLPKTTSGTDDINGYVLKYIFEGSNDIAPIGSSPLPHTTNYFYGNAPSKWSVNVRSYGTIIYENLWDGIDLRYLYGREGPKYEFVLNPKADPTAIKIRVEGHESLALTQGDLAINIPNGRTMFDQDLRVYYEDNTRETIATQFVLVDEDCFGFKLENYDNTRQLIIDPFIYSTYLGGTNGETGYSIEYDSTGNAYVTGIVRSIDFPTTAGCWDDVYNTDWDVFVTKYDPSGSNLLYSTFVGGDLAEVGYGIDIDSSNNAYVTGYTASSDFPFTLGANDTTHNGGNDAFIFRLNAAGSNLVYSTFLGGSGSDVGYGIYVDVSLNAFITGSTTSANYPIISGAFDNSHNGGQDIMVSKLDGTGATLLKSTFIGSTGDDIGNAITIGRGREPYITGETNSDTGFPTSFGAYQETYGGGDTDAFVLRVNSSFGFLTYCTYVGGSDTDNGNAIAINSSSYAYVTGETKSANFPIEPGAYDSAYKGGGVYEDVFVFKVHPAGISLNFSTFVSGGHNDNAYGIALDADDNAYVAGYSHSTNFPTTGDAYNQTLNGARDVIMFKLDSTGSSLLYSTFIGGGGLETGNDIAFDKSNNAYVTGWTWSVDFPVTPGANDTTYNTNEDIFVYKFLFGDSLSPPRGLQADIGNSYIELSWVKPASNGSTPIVGYKIYRGLSSGLENLIDSVGVVTTYNDTTITNGQVYYYYVTAENQTKESDPSNEVRAADEEVPMFWVDATSQAPTTGDEFVFAINVTDNVLVSSVYVDYWYGNETHTNTSMINITAKSWELAITIDDVLDTFQYIFYADDPSVNWDATVQQNLTVIDNDLTVFVADNSPTVATTGDSYEFAVEVTDNIEVDEVWVEYWFGSGTHYNEYMDKGAGDGWSHAITVPLHSAEPLLYIFHANDTSNNLNETPVTVINVTDNDLAVFLTDNTPTTATTGDSFEFVVEVTDNILIKQIYVELWYGISEGPYQLSMEWDSGNEWTNEIEVEDTLENLNYIFHARDHVDNWNQTTQKSITIIDNDKPVFEMDPPPDQARTGEDYSIYVGVTDNIEIKNVSVEYWFGTGGKSKSLLEYDQGIVYSGEISIPIDTTEKLYFELIAYDTSDNIRTSSQFVSNVIDTISPTIQLISDLTVGQGDTVNITVVADDNIGVTDIVWTGAPFAAKYDKFEGVVDTIGDYNITVSVYDAAGNAASTSFRLTVMSASLDTDDDGMPNLFEELHNLNPNDASDAGEDSDNDGLSNLKEYQAMTLPRDDDTDDDGMPDGWEVNYGLDPLTASADNDEDGDGVSDLQEYLDDTDPTRKGTDTGTDKESEDNWWLIIVVLVIVIVIVIIIMVLFLKKRQASSEIPPEGVPPEAAAGELPTIAPPPAMPVSYPEQELIQDYQQLQPPQHDEVPQIAQPPVEQPVQLGQVPEQQQIGIPPPLPIEQLPTTEQPQLPPTSEPLPSPEPELQVEPAVTQIEDKEPAPQPPSPEAPKPQPTVKEPQEE